MSLTKYFAVKPKEKEESAEQSADDSEMSAASGSDLLFPA